MVHYFEIGALLGAFIGFISCIYVYFIREDEYEGELINPEDYYFE